MKDFYLIRHGQSRANAGFPAVSPYEEALTELGQEQARLTAAHLTKTPDLTKNVPNKLNENAAIASKTVHDLNTLRFSVTAKLCIKAVPTNQGINEAFSTGSQNHQPPQPSS